MARTEKRFLIKQLFISFEGVFAMSIWLKTAIYSLAGAILGSVIIGMLFSGAATTNEFGSGAYRVPAQSYYGGYNNSGYTNISPYSEGGYTSGMKMGMGTSNSGCKNRR